jgi:O-acetyl-ADP-ribose deacetylase
VPIVGWLQNRPSKNDKGLRLPAKHIIHTVGPVWRDGLQGEPELLQACYTNAIQIAIRQGLRSLAFPSISTSVYRFPIDQAASIAVQTVRQILLDTPSSPIEQVIFCCFSQADCEVNLKLLSDEQ